jgi:uncharacterized membrane protein YfcA
MILGLMAPWPVISVAGALIGALMGFFGVGGSSVATPVLSLLGVGGPAAVASPLPATIPSAMLAAVPYIRGGEARPKAAAWSLLGAIPATVAGALLSRRIGGDALVLASGIVLVVVGVRVLFPIADASREAGTKRRLNRPLLVAAAAGVGLFTGLLANGGAFLLMPMYLLVFGLRMRQAVGTSLLVVASLSLPTLLTHWALGHIDWGVSASLLAGRYGGASSGASSPNASRVPASPDGRSGRFSSSSASCSPATGCCCKCT